MNEMMKLAIEEARKSLQVGGIPIGAVLTIDGRVVGRGHNQRVQRGSSILHAEMDCLENAGRLRASDYRKATLYTTLCPCDMCAGAILLYHIPVVVVGECETFRGAREYLAERKIQVTVLEDDECRSMMRTFIAERPELWNEDIGV